MTRSSMSNGWYDHGWGYPLVLIIMGGVAALMLYFFKKKKWL